MSFMIVNGSLAYGLHFLVVRVAEINLSSRLVEKLRHPAHPSHKTLRGLSARLELKLDLQIAGGNNSLLRIRIVILMIDSGDGTTFFCHKGATKGSCDSGIEIDARPD